MKQSAILIVDDEESFLKMCHKALKREGYSSLTLAENGSNALEILQSNQLDLVITDLMMPGHIDGRKLVREIRNQFKQTDVIIMTAHPTVESAIEILKEGAYDYLIKPFNPEELISAVARCLEKRELKNNLEKAYRELKTLHDSRENFMQLLVHDMKNPLSGIMGNVNILLMDDRDGEEKETLEDILKSSERLHQMVINLLDIRQMEDGKLPLQIEKIELNQALAEILKLMKNQFESKKIKVGIEKLSNNIFIDGDRDLVFRIFQNLLSHSLHFTSEGGKVEISLQKMNKHVAVKVRDNGQPIPQEFRETIFTRYGRLTKGGDRSNRGLGLYFCKLAVEAHGGTIELENSGKGAAFLIKFAPEEKNGG